MSSNKRIMSFCIRFCITKFAYYSLLINAEVNRFAVSCVLQRCVWLRQADRMTSAVVHDGNESAGAAFIVCSCAGVNQKFGLKAAEELPEQC